MMSHRVVMYTKPGCHLCEDAMAMLRDLQNEFALAIEERDITTNDAWFKQYFEKIPVLMIDDHVTLAAPLRADEVRASLSSVNV
ncbi:MAG: glutaredoxin family protein [Chloroflexi bacterium]|nr:glutaredoxin family protein [Chloroflexota bacterium]